MCRASSFEEPEAPPPVRPPLPPGRRSCRYTSPTRRGPGRRTGSRGVLDARQRSLRRGVRRIAVRAADQRSQSAPGSPRVRAFTGGRRPHRHAAFLPVDARVGGAAGRDGAGVRLAGYRRLDREMDLFAERLRAPTALEPEFQDFLGKLVKKIGKGVKSVAKMAVKGITTLGLGPILNRIKALVRPLLNQVLQKAIGRLPASVAAGSAQPCAAPGLRAEARGARGRPRGRARRTAARASRARSSTMAAAPPGTAAPEPPPAGCGFARPARPPAPRSRTCSSSSTS